MREEPKTGCMHIDVAALSQAAEHDGPQWGHASEDLNLTLLHWTEGQLIAPHVNDEVDVLLLVIAGAGEAIVDMERHTLTPGQVLLIPKGAERALCCAGAHFSYLSVHRRRRGLWPT
jgi:quercetin dioxygenase-like cupin family protein